MENRRVCRDNEAREAHLLNMKYKCEEFLALDPVYERVLDEACKEKKKPKVKPQGSEDVVLKPTLSTRLQLMKTCLFEPSPYPCCGTDIPRPRYVAPKTKKFKECQKERRELYKKMLDFHEYKVVELPGPDRNRTKTMDLKLEVPSAEIKEAKLMPRKPSATPSDLYPDPPSATDLKKKQPKSGTVINVKKKKKKKKPLQKVIGVIEHNEPTIRDIIAQELETIAEVGEGGEEGPPPESLRPPEDYLTKQFRKKVEQMSKTTSLQSRDYKVKKEAKEGGEGEESEEEEIVEEKEDRFINKLVQKFRRESEIHVHQKPKRKIKRGTLENFSFTRLKQPTLKTFYYGVKLGTISQDDRNFSDVSRNKQGICMPIAAYCYSILKHPDRWTQADIDNVLESGDNLFRESAGTQHLHGDNVELEVSNLRKYCTVGKKKIRFEVSEPEISGMIYSDDKKVYNLTQALNIFFTRYKAGIFHTENLSVAIWKDRHFYFFDAGHRTIDLYTHENGVALMANFYDTCSVLSVLLDRSNLWNDPFIIYSIRAYKILMKDAEEVESTGVIPEIDNFQVLDEEKAVALGGFDLADKCFGFSRNKQALTVAVVALVYSKISPPSSWHRGTIDKIVIIGTQLFLECIEDDIIEEVKVDDLPAIFTIGPYVVEIRIAANCMTDFMMKKSKNMLQERMEKFFETNSNAIVQIQTYTIAVWKQRNIFHCLDPYSRNREGLKCRDGSACVSMHTTLESMIQMISKNFDEKDMIFYVHAMKVCKIHRDPNTRDLFPKCLTMNEYPTENFKKMKMRRGKKKAVTKTVTVDRDTRAILMETIGDSSLIEVGSTVRSIGLEDLPQMCQRTRSKSTILKTLTPMDENFVADLGSPSLSDTQIEPPHPEETGEESPVTFQDLDSFELTQEEKEFAGRGEGAEGGQENNENESSPVDSPEGGEDNAGGQEWYMAATKFTQIGSHSLMGRTSGEVNTDEITVVIPEEEVPPACRNVAALIKWKKSKFEEDKTVLEEEPEVTLSEELAKETNFVDMPDASQIVSGSTNMAAFGGDLEVMAPFVCIMATVVSKKYSIDSWSREVIDYVIQCGAELYNSSTSRYDQNYKLEIPRLTLGTTDFTVKVSYIFDTFIKPRILTLSLHNLLFCHHQAGILVTPTYSCALFKRNHLYYLYDGFANNEVGLGKGSNEGVACLSRFKDIYGLVVRILHNKSKREEEENVEYNRFVLSSCYVKRIPKLEPVDRAGEARGYHLVEGYDYPMFGPGKKKPRYRYYDVEGDESHYRRPPYRPGKKQRRPQRYGYRHYQMEGDEYPVVYRPGKRVPKWRHRKDEAAVGGTGLQRRAPRPAKHRKSPRRPKRWGHKHHRHGEMEEDGDAGGGGGYYDYDDFEGGGGGAVGGAGVKPAQKKPLQEPEKKPCKLGYQQVEDLCKIEGTKCVGGETTVVENSVKEDYLVALCACLMRLNLPFKNWSSKKVDTVVDNGLSVYKQYQEKDQLRPCMKKFIKNILIENYLFDVLVRQMNFVSYKTRRSFKAGIYNMIAKKHQHFILQFPNRSYALSVDGTTYHLFDPSDPSKKASWTKYTSFIKLANRIQSGLVKNHVSFNIHVFEVMGISKAPRDVIISNKSKRCKCQKSKKSETIGKVFYEEFSWLGADPIPWSWRLNKSKLGVWNDWFVEFQDDLFSLFGSLSPLDERFPKKIRNKQTLGNLVVAIGMMQIYELAEWSVNVMDSVLIHGTEFFQTCIKDITDDNYEIAFEDIKKECVIFPYQFNVQFTPVVEGTIFLVRLKQFNLYKALRFFFDDYEKRFGVICVTKGEKDKRLFAFGKVQDSEYFLYDCITLGPPMYNERNGGVPYILRTTTLNRLLHVMTLTLRGGDFYIFEVGLSELTPVKA